MGTKDLEFGNLKRERFSGQNRQMAAVFSQVDLTSPPQFPGWKTKMLVAVACFRALREKEEASLRQGCKLIPGLGQI